MKEKYRVIKIYIYKTGRPDLVWRSRKASLRERHLEEHETDWDLWTIDDSSTKPAQQRQGFRKEGDHEDVR